MPFANMGLPTPIGSTEQGENKSNQIDESNGSGSIKIHSFFTTILNCVHTVGLQLDTVAIMVVLFICTTKQCIFKVFK